MEFICPPFLQASSAAALFERLTAIVETTTAHLNAIGRRSGRGIGGGTGPETGNLVRFLPDTRKVAKVSGMIQSADFWEEKPGI